LKEKEIDLRNSPSAPAAQQQQPMQPQQPLRLQQG